MTNLTRAEARCVLADYAGAEQDADAVGRPDSVRDQARLHRVRGLIAMDGRDYDAAAEWFGTARVLFESEGHNEGVAIIDRDQVLLGVRRGDPDAMAAVLATPPRTMAEHLQVAQALRRELRYEEALRVLGGIEDADAALLPLVRAEENSLRHLIRADDTDYEAEPDSPRFDGRLHHTHVLVTQCRELLAAGRPAEAAVRADRAESALVELSHQTGNRAEEAAWHLCAGELELVRRDLLDRARASGDEVDEATRQAEGHLRRAAQLADTTATAEVRLLAIRLLGHAQAMLEAGDDAVESWRAAHHIEEDIAARQVSDGVKARMLSAAGDEHDERVNAAAAAVDRRGLAAAAGVAVAIESARGHTILDAIGGRPATPPRPGDVQGACDWVRELARDLPGSQAMWLMYAGPDRVHHVLAGRTELHYYATPPRRSFRHRLVMAVERLMSFWDETVLERSVRSGDFDDALAAIEELVDAGPVLRALPAKATRVAVVAHGILAHVPVAALSTSDGGRVLHRAATSDLPSWASRRPLAHRAARRRGDRSLLVSPTVPFGRVREAVPGHAIVRVDCHGKWTADDAWLQLAPDGPEGRLRQEDLQSFDLNRCGTAILGACDSAMATTTGRDERVGFVRSAMHAGAAAVVASRWIAEEPVAGALLDRFERYLRYQPRDVALRRAQLDVCAGRTPHAGLPEHPSRWACWTLHGDAGWQTAAGPLRRLVRAKRDDGRNREYKSPEGVPVLCR